MQKNGVDVSGLDTGFLSSGAGNYIATGYQAISSPAASDTYGFVWTSTGTVNSGVSGLHISGTLQCSP